MPQTGLAATMSHTSTVLQHWDQIQAILASENPKIKIDGYSLDISSVVAVTRYNTQAQLSESCKPKIDESTAYFQKCLSEGRSIYGVNTGFGGSAGVRTKDPMQLQRNLLNFLNCGVIDEQGIADSSIPPHWVQATILIRANTLARGHSGVRGAVVDGLLDFLKHDIVPVIPLRGSISASGDLIPLSYIAGALQGRPEIKVLVNATSKIPSQPSKDLSNGLGPKPNGNVVESRKSGECCNDVANDIDSEAGPLSLKNGSSNGSWAPEARQREVSRISSAEVFPKLNLKPLTLEPKEALSLVNGTAVSAGTGALINHDVQCLAVFSQILTAMSVEALNGTAESFDPFFAAIRPHAGQVEAADNIRCFLQGSKLTAEPNNGTNDFEGLRQDRYSLRTSPQWIGPQLEDLLLAHHQIKIECNSTTDNPVLDARMDTIFHGGNFQATSITSAMEKMRQSLQSLGRMLFAQCSEIINPSLNNGLPPNLEAGEPSEGFLMKGVDVSIASLQSELGFLANPLTSHVQTAEMGNQSLNSLAFLSARYTNTASTVLMQLAASHAFVVCQALDLRCIQLDFLETLKSRLHDIGQDLFNQHFDNPDCLEALLQAFWKRFCLEFAKTVSIDSDVRFHTIFQTIQTEAMLASELKSPETLFSSLKTWTGTCASTALDIYREVHAQYAAHPDPSRVLGAASRKIMPFIRDELKVPFNDGITGFGDVSVGEMITRIYASMRDGRLFGVAMDCLRDHTSNGST